MKGKTAKYYASHPDARKRHREYQAEYQKSDAQVKRRVELNKINRQRGQYADKDGKDMSHKPNGKIVEESASKNRGSKSNSAGDRIARGTKRKK